MTDCGQNACPLCSDSWDGTQPCTGVIGAAQPEQTTDKTITPTSTTFNGADPIWKTGNANFTGKEGSFQTKWKNNEPICYDSTRNVLGRYNKTGECIPGSLKDGINHKVMQTKTLLVDGDDFNAFEKKDAGTFPLQALHKIWGSGPTNKPFNRGVNSRNVYISPSESVQCNISGKSTTIKQKVMVMEAHGDLYAGDVPGITKVPKVKGAKNPNNPLLPVCPKWEQLSPTDTDFNKRVGGVACTRDQYGPGVYNILAYVPKTTDTSTDGRGYVFAIWPYNYAEIYSKKDKDGKVSYPPQYMVDENTPCSGMCDISPYNAPLKTGSTDKVSPWPPACPENLGDNCGGADTFTVINHEIDIEIPCNSPQLDWKSDMTWDTMNCNTWLTDTGNYDETTGGYYTQVAAKKKGGGTFISKEPENSKDKDYHWYTLDWHVENDDATKNYVSFYFDDPFDPSGQTKFNGVSLPKGPSGSGFVHKTARFVPMLAGRLNLGPWMAWWGYGGQTNGIPNFDTAKVRLAHLSIIPMTQQGGGIVGGYSFPQSYDQPDVVCDFVDMYSKGKAPVPLGPPISKRSLLFWILWSLGVISGLALVGALYVYKKRKDKKG